MGPWNSITPPNQNFHRFHDIPPQDRTLLSTPPNMIGKKDTIAQWTDLTLNYLAPSYPIEAITQFLQHLLYYTSLLIPSHHRSIPPTMYLPPKPLSTFPSIPPEYIYLQASPPPWLKQEKQKTGDKALRYDLQRYKWNFFTVIRALASQDNGKLPST